MNPRIAVKNISISPARLSAAHQAATSSAVTWPACHGPVDRSPVELLVDGEPGCSGQADDVRDDSYVTQAGPPEQPEELAADPGVRHRCIQHFRDPACQRRVRRIDHGLIRVEVKGQHGSAGTRQARHLPQSCLRSVQVAQDALGPALIESVVREVDMAGVADFEGDGEGQVRCTPAGLGDHGWIGVDPDHPPLRPYPAARLRTSCPSPQPTSRT